jgi:chemotaxis protein MotB
MRKKSGGHDGGGGGHDGAGGMRWLLTYSDMITLLLALFIFLYSISEVNEAKLDAFTSSLRELFGIGRVPQSSESRSGGSGILPAGNSIVELRQRWEREFRDLIKNDMVEVTQTEEGLVLRLRDKILFSLGKAELSRESLPFLNEIGSYLRGIPNLVRVEGHTDHLPVTPGGLYASNWELSGARAAEVVRFLIVCGVSPRRLSLAGYADNRPISPNRGQGGSPQNRRVEIVVINTAKSSSIPISSVQ